MTQSGSLAFRSFFSENFAPGGDPEELSHDRLGFAFCLALALHCAIILGVSFSREDVSLAPTKLEITLAQHSSEKAPDEADFLAQANQQGSGTLEEKAMLTTREQADFQDVSIHEVVPQQKLSSSQPQIDESAKIATTQSMQFKTNTRENEGRILETAKQPSDDLTILERSVKIASLEAKLDIQRQAYAKRPRVRRLTSVATKQSDDALYLHDWRTKIEAIGNQNYPAKARQQGLYGDLRLVVSLLPSGDIHQVKILKSSGHKILDQAAIRIVHLAAPFDPFPRVMGQSVDILEIIRTWSFQKGKLTSSS
jgi:periplasmic protein TonB